jgi:hypothetical protein
MWAKSFDLRAPDPAGGVVPSEKAANGHGDTFTAAARRLHIDPDLAWSWYFE